MAILISILFIFSLILSVFVFGFSVAQLGLAYNYIFKKKSLNDNLSPYLLTKTLPFVTIQLPIYNESYVVERLLKCIANIEYPKHFLEIQVLDDSTDDTSEIIANCITKLSKLGHNFIHIQRQNRQGYKAGALAFSLPLAKGEFIAIFDADFLPKSTFLLETLPYFKNLKVGIVQTRWEHINKNYSWLTQLQAFGLDGHFYVDQIGRMVGNHFGNFNGTAGIWRKSCIVDAGSWNAETLTEDLDLSYRAQLKGWKLVYLEKLGSPAELPVEIKAVKAQQYRWAKGAAQNAKKHLVNVLFNPGLTYKTKFYAFFHLLNSGTFLGLFILALLAIPLLFFQNYTPQYLINLMFVSKLFKISFLFLGIYFGIAYFKSNKSIVKFIFLFPAFLAFMMGLSLSLAYGIWQGYLGHKSPFIRTPKYNILTKTDSWQKNKYINHNFDWYIILEGILVIYFGFGIYLAYQVGDFSSISYLAMLLIGFVSVFTLGIRHLILNK